MKSLVSKISIYEYIMWVQTIFFMPKILKILWGIKVLSTLLILNLDLVSFFTLGAENVIFCMFELQQSELDVAYFIGLGVYL